MPDPRLEEMSVAIALQVDASQRLLDQVRALMVINAALLKQLGDRVDLSGVRREALLAFADEGPDSGVARAIIAIVGSGEYHGGVYRPGRLGPQRLN